MIKFPSIVQFRNVIRNVQSKVRYNGKDEEGNAVYNTKPLPTLKFTSSVKLHGTNAAIVQDIPNGIVVLQSREREICVGDDNAGFAAHMADLDLMTYFKEVRSLLNTNESIAIYGEWCGGNIQKGVSITGLNKMFVVFAVLVGDVWIRHTDSLFEMLGNSEIGFFTTQEFKTFSLDIDFNNPEYSQNELSKLTLEVEEECPVGLKFGVSGVGEGIVWSCISEGFEGSDFVFKTKGEKHSVSKVKTIGSVDIEKLESLKALSESLMTENRIKQMMEQSEDKENLGQIIKACLSDVFKEELDTIVGNGFTDKEFAKQATQIVRKVWLNRN